MSAAAPGGAARLPTRSKSDLSDTVWVMVRMTATEASRNFSEVLGRVGAGESVEIVRNGAPVARLMPPAQRLLSAEAFAQLLDSAPSVDDAFAEDVAAARRELELPVDAWPS